MFWKPQLTNLRNQLAKLYWRVADVERIVSEVSTMTNLQPDAIAWHTKPLNLWQSILEEAEKQEAVLDIVAVARKEYPNLQSLLLAEQNLLRLAVTTPLLDPREWQGPEETGQLEALIAGVSSLLPISYLERGLQVARSVARIVRADGVRGTGFLAPNNLLITNHHVLRTAAEAAGAVVEFNYQKTIDDNDAPVATYKLVPAEGFATSPIESEGGDDWTAVRVEGDPAANWGVLPLRRADPQLKGRALIIQHPGGGPKRIALDHSVIAAVSPKRVQYLTDTLEGSSGSPVFNLDWQVVAVHHKGGELPDLINKKVYVRNQGIHINVVMDGLATAGIQ